MEKVSSVWGTFHFLFNEVNERVLICEKQPGMLGLEECN